MNFREYIQNARGKRLLIGGHRGHLSETRENTIANFEEAARIGVDYIEIDVQLTKDAQAVIYHDMDLAERSPLKGRIRDYTVSELKAAFELCTLEEAVLWCKNNGMFMLLEIKRREWDGYEDRPILAQRIASCLEAHAFFQQCIVFSIDHKILQMIKQSKPEATIALIVPHVPHDPAALMESMKADIYLSFLDNLSISLVEELHNAGFIVDGSVVNTPELLERALWMNVDMIESDYPEQIIPLYKKTEAAKS